MNEVGQSEFKRANAILPSIDSVAAPVADLNAPHPDPLPACGAARGERMRSFNDVHPGRRFACPGLPSDTPNGVL